MSYLTHCIVVETSDHRMQCNELCSGQAAQQKQSTGRSMDRPYLRAIEGDRPPFRQPQARLDVRNVLILQLRLRTQPAAWLTTVHVKNGLAQSDSIVPAPKFQSWGMSELTSCRQMTSACSIAISFESESGSCRTMNVP